MGNRETATDDRGVTTYTYDNRNRLETLTYPDGRKLTYGYDASGNRTSLTAEVGGQTLTTTYSYDELNRLQTVTDSEGRDYVHEYDPNGNREKLTYPNNTETSYVYDDLNRLTNLTTINTATLGMIQSYQFTLGAAGNREQIDEHDGTSRAYTYDDLYRLEKETVSDSVGLVYEKSFVYDPVGNRESQTTIGTGAPGTPLAPGTIDYTYDDRDRIVTEGTQPYGWDDNGNLVTKDAEASYTWDFENRLTRVEKADGDVVTHAYDADGNRVRTEITPSTGPPEVTEFLVDTSGSLSHVVAESTDSGTLIAQYVRGDDLLSVIRPGETRFSHADGLGSIRRMTSEAGAITDGYSFTAFGELTAHTGSDPQPYAFAGEPLDLNSGWQHHRARWMDPGTARFASVDPFVGTAWDPASLHRYSYAKADPQNNVDPTGEVTLGQITTVVNAIGNLQTTATVAVNILTGNYTVAAGQIAEEVVYAKLGALGRPIGHLGRRGVNLFYRILGHGITLKLGRPGSSRILAENLAAVGVGRPGSAAAHHIVAWNATRAQQGRRILEKHAIDINAPTNGVFLPRTGASAASGSPHRGGHLFEYFDEVNDRLVAADAAGGKVRVLNELAAIKVDLLTGRLAIGRAK